MIADKLERRVLDTLLSIFKLTSHNFNSVTYKEYIKERRVTTNGFIGYQVPRKGIDRIYRNDFVIYIPNIIDVRIECKSLDVISVLSRAVITEERLITETMPENNLILLAVGNGFNSQEFIKTINKTKSRKTSLISDMSEMFNFLS